MRTFFRQTCVLFLVFAAGLISAPAPAAETVAILSGRIIDGRSARPLVETVIVVEGERIAAIGDRKIIPPGAQIVDLGSSTLLPGMIDGHVHPLMHADDYQNAHITTSSAYKALKALKAVQNLLGAGWTTLRVLGDGDVYYGQFDLRKVIDEGVFIGPRITGAGHYLSIIGGGGDVNFTSPEQKIIPDGIIVNGSDEVRRAVREEIKYGSDWIKILVTGAFQSVGDNPQNVHFSPEELQTAMDEATRLGVPVAAHAHAADGIKQAVRAGVRSIEHGTFMDDEAIRLMVKHGTFLVPTAYIGDYYSGENNTLLASEKQDDYVKNYRQHFLKMIGEAHKAGVKIAVGVDFGGYHYDPTISAREFAILVEAGMTPMEAIQAGTRVGAEMLRWDDRLGTLETGKLADIIAVAGDPLSDISELERVTFVMIGGKVFKQP